MNEEIMTTTNEEIMENEVTELTEVYEDMPTETSGSGIVGKVVKGVVVLGVGAAVALAVKNKDKLIDKLNERKAKKLEKHGYVVLKPEDIEEIDEFDDENVEVEADSEESVETSTEE